MQVAVWHRLSKLASFCSQQSLGSWPHTFLIPTSWPRAFNLQSGTGSLHKPLFALSSNLLAPDTYRSHSETLAQMTPTALLKQWIPQVMDNLTCHKFEAQNYWGTTHNSWEEEKILRRLQQMRFLWYNPEKNLLYRQERLWSSRSFIYTSHCALTKSRISLRL